MKTIRTKQAKVQLAYFVQRDQHGVIAKDLTQSSISMWRFRFRCRRSFLNSLFIESEVKVLYVRSESSQFGSKGLPGPLTFSTFFFQMGLYYVTYVIFFIIWELAVQVEMPFPPFMDHTCNLTWMHGVPKPSIFGSSKLVCCAKCSNASDIKSLTWIRLN